jgi:hypothetical protein
MTCKDCRFYNRSRVENKAGRVQRNCIAECLFPVKLPPLPVSARPVSVDLRWMEPFDGAGCPVFEVRERP